VEDDTSSHLWKRERKPDGSELPLLLDAPSPTECENDYQRELVERVRRFTRDATAASHYALTRILGEYRYGGGRAIGERLRRYLEEKNLLLPTFDLAFGEEAEGLLTAAELDDRIPQGGLSPDQAVLIFQLPKVLKYFWWKSNESVREGTRVYGEHHAYTRSSRDQRDAKWLDEAEKSGLQNMIIEWGKMYSEYIPTIWHVRANYEGDALCFERLNKSGEHDPDEYYYVWIIEPGVKTQQEE